MKKTQLQRLDSVRDLVAKKGHNSSPVFIVNVVSVSSSGMTRKMDVYLMNEYFERVNSEIAELLDIKQDKNGRLIISGCGMDMCYWLVDRISRELGTDMLPYKMI